MRLVHISDWHGYFRDLPPGDVYIVTGDMLRNYPKLSYDAIGFGRAEIVPSREKRLQEEWFAKKGETLRKFFPKDCKDAPVVCVRGNHDFTDLGPMFGGEVYEIQAFGDTFEIGGLKFGGFRGISKIDGRWCDEFSKEYFDDHMHELPLDIDVVVTHAPPAGILDKCDSGERAGIEAYREYLNVRNYLDEYTMPKACCFGHIHEAVGLENIPAGTIFSNAAMTIHEFEIAVS